MNIIDDQGCEHLSQGLKYVPNLTVLNLNENKIGDQGCEHLSQGLKYVPNLNSLNLHRNRISDQGCEHLSQRLNYVPNLTTLYMTFNDNITKDMKDKMRNELDSKISTFKI